MEVVEYNSNMAVMVLLRSVLNYSADLIKRLFFALRQAYEQIQAHTKTICNMQAHHEASVLRTEIEKQEAQLAFNHYRSLRHDAEATAMQNGFLKVMTR